MFAAFQKASWNWSPVSASGESSDSEEEKKSCPEMHRVNIENENTAKSRKRRSPRNSGRENNSRWSDIPLSSDEEDQVSSSGVSEFRKMSESDGGGESLQQHFDDSSPSPPSVAYLQSPAFQNAILTSWSPAAFFGQIAQNVSPENRSPDLPAEAKQPNIGSTFETQTYQDNATGDKCEIQPKFLLDIQAKQAASSRKSTGKCNKRQSKTYRRLEMASPVGQAVQASPSTRSMEMQTVSKVSTSATQTPKKEDEFASAKTALELQLADALNALDLTRNQANALRERLRTYTSSMKQQAEDLRASSRSLSHALDKAVEYKTCWKEEVKLREQASKRAAELDLRVNQLEHSLSEKDHEAKILACNIDALNRLLGIEGGCDSVEDKLAMASKKVQSLLVTVDKVQADAALAAVVSTVELKESLQRFEEEKSSWATFARSNNEIFTGEINTLQMENGVLKEKVNALKESSNEIRELWKKATIDNENKDKRLQENVDTIKQFETNLAVMQSRLESSEELRRTYQQENLKIGVEKRNIDAELTSLKRELREKRLKMRDQSSDCSLLSTSDFSGDESLSSNDSMCPSKSQLLELRKDRSALKRQVEDLKNTISDMKRDAEDKDRDYYRMRGDLRQLSWTMHHYEAGIQRVRAENRYLRVSISKLKRGMDEEDTEIKEESAPQKPSPYESYDSGSKVLPKERERQRSHSGSSADSSSKLRTIRESSDEGKVSRSGISPASSKALLAASQPVPADAPGVVDLSQMKVQVVRRVEEIKRESIPSPHPEKERKRSSTSTASNTLDDAKSVPTRKRSRKGRRSPEMQLPIWRQENPENQFSIAKAQGKVPSERRTSVGSEIIFKVNSQSSSSWTPSKRSSRKTSSLGGEIKPMQRSRFVGLPMSEKEFEKLVGSMNDVTPIAPAGERRRHRTNETNVNDDGYSSSSPEGGDVPIYGDPLHSTPILLPRGSVDSSNQAQSSKRRERNSSSKSYKTDGDQCLVSYNNTTFDATKFTMCELRQFTWHAGIADYSPEMEKFFDFLAKTAEELNQDPEWCDRHTLGNPADWLGLKGLLC